MARLIDANALDEKLDAIAKRYYEQGRFDAAKDYSFVQTVLLSAPTVDAVEVVRCEGCRWFEPYKDDRYSKGQCLHAHGLCHNLSPMDYCSLGERKDNG